MNLHEQLIRDEGLRLKPYRDTVGKLTIGVGRNLDDEGITQAEAEILEDNDIDTHTSSLLTALPWVMSLDAVRKAVLINICFNIGIHGLLEFKKTLTLIQESKFGDAAEELIDSKWADQVGSRATRLAMQLESGKWV